MNMRTRAFTLTELAVVLAIVGFVTMGVWGASATISENLRLHRAEDLIHSTIINFDNFQSTSGGGGSAFAFPPDLGCPSGNSSEITKAAMQAGLFSEDKGLLPPDWNDPLATTRLKSPWAPPADIRLYINTYDGCSGDITHTVSISL